MRTFIKQLNRELETVAPHIPSDGPLRNPDCPHCDILATYMMKDPKTNKQQEGYQPGSRLEN